MDSKPRKFTSEHAAVLCNFAELVMRVLEGQVLARHPASSVLEGSKRSNEAYHQATAVVDTSADCWKILHANPAFDALSGSHLLPLPQLPTLSILYEPCLTMMNFSGGFTCYSAHGSGSWKEPKCSAGGAGKSTEEGQFWDIFAAPPGCQGKKPDQIPGKCMPVRCRGSAGFRGPLQATLRCAVPPSLPEILDDDVNSWRIGACYSRLGTKPLACMK